MVAPCNSAGVVAGQPEIDAVPPRSEFGMVIDRLGMRRDPGQEREGGGEIGKTEALDERRRRTASYRPARWRGGRTGVRMSHDREHPTLCCPSILNRTFHLQDPIMLPLDNKPALIVADEPFIAFDLADLAV